MPNAKITAIDRDKNLTAREGVSSTGGQFQLINLQPGFYTLRFEAAGFKSLDRTDVRLDQNQILNLGSINLTVGQTTESVTVEAAVPQQSKPQRQTKASRLTRAR